MNLIIFVLIIGATGVGGVVIGYFLRWLVTLGQKGSMELTVKQTILEAKDRAQQIINDAEREATKTVAEVEAKEKEKNVELKKWEDRLIKKDELLDKRQTDVDSEAERLKKENEELKNSKEVVNQLTEKKTKKLERIAKLSKEEAQQELFKIVEKQHEEDLSVQLHKLETTGAEKYEQKAKDILASVIQRLCTSTVPEVMSTTVAIPSDDVKGKIIGKEG